MSLRRSLFSPGLAPLPNPIIPSVSRRAVRLDSSLCRRCQSRAYSSSKPNPSNKNSGSGGDGSNSSSTKSESIPVANIVSPLPLWQRLGPLTSVASAYARAQKRRPWTTQFFSALVIYGLADLSAQSINSEEDIDPKRTARSLVIGGVAAIPSYSWFMFLSHHFNYASHALSLAVKIVVSQIIFAPTFNTYFFGSQALLSGCSLSGVADRIRKTVPTSVVNSCQFWPFVTAFSFTFVPMEYRAVFSGVVAIGWQTYLALLNRRAELKARAEMGMSVSEEEQVDHSQEHDQDAKARKVTMD